MALWRDEPRLPHRAWGADRATPSAAAPGGIVIGGEVVIGADVTIYQNVTLGRAHADEGSNPVIKDGVTLYAGAMVIGAVTIGAGAVVGAPARMVGKHVVTKEMDVS